MINDDDAIRKATDLFFEIKLLTDLYSGLHDQLKAIEDHYGIEYGYENLLEEYRNRKNHASSESL